MERVDAATSIADVLNDMIARLCVFDDSIDPFDRPDIAVVTIDFDQIAMTVARPCDFVNAHAALGRAHFTIAKVTDDFFRIKTAGAKTQFIFAPLTKVPRAKARFVEPKAALGSETGPEVIC
jgi:hypothetical protein